MNTLLQISKLIEIKTGDINGLRGEKCVLLFKAIDSLAA